MCASYVGLDAVVCNNSVRNCYISLGIEPPDDGGFGASKHVLHIIKSM